MVRAGYSSGSFIVLGLCCALTTAQRFVFSSGGGGRSSDCRTPDGQGGKCIDVLSCKPISDYIDAIQNRVNNDIRNKIQAYKCGQQNSEYPKVCCPPGPIVLPGDTDLQTDDNVKLLPVNDCGVAPNLDRIVNGENASLYEFPWMAALLYDSRSGPEFGCGGTLINKRYILTAAHCIRAKKQLVGVRLGEHNFETETDCDVNPFGKICAPPVQNFDVTVDDVIVHPKYNGDTLSDDIALIRLRRDADLTAISVKPVCLPVQRTAKRTKFEQNLTVCGWGTTEKGGYSPFLLKVVIPAIENNKCSQFYTGAIVITDQQLCAGGRESKNTCTGDSGGPLMQQVYLNDLLRTVQYGVVSAGPILCEKTDFPVRYTRVTSYMDWILANIKA